MPAQPWQGVRPAALQKVSSSELAEFIAVCIQPKAERPRARQLLKAPYFDSIREKAVRCEAALSATTSQVRAARSSLQHLWSQTSLDAVALC